MANETSAPAAPAQQVPFTESASAPGKTDTPATAPATEASPENPRKFKVKVDNQELEVSEADLIRNYQKGIAADKRFNEASQMHKQAEEFIGLLRSNPMKVLTDPRLSIDMKKIAEDYVYEQYQLEQMTPEQREAREMKERLTRYEQEEKARKEQEEAKRAQELTDKWTQNYTKDIMTAIEKSGLPRSEHTVRRMAYYMHQSLKNGLGLTAIDVVDLVRNDYNTEIKSLLGGLDGDVLLSFVGDDLARKIQKHDIQRLRKTGDSKPQEPASRTSTGSSSSDKKISKAEWKERMRVLKGE